MLSKRGINTAVPLFPSAVRTGRVAPGLQISAGAAPADFSGNLPQGRGRARLVGVTPGPPGSPGNSGPAEAGPACTSAPRTPPRLPGVYAGTPPAAPLAPFFLIPGFSLESGVGGTRDTEGVCQAGGFPPVADHRGGAGVRVPPLSPGPGVPVGRTPPGLPASPTLRATSRPPLAEGSGRQGHTCENKRKDSCGCCAR